MFSESLLEFSAGRARRGWSTALAWTLQSMLIALAIVLPLWQTNALPRVMGDILTIPVPPPAAPPAHAHTPTHASASDHPNPVNRDGSLNAPIRVPIHVDMTPDQAREEESGPPCTWCVVGGTESLDSPRGNGLRNLLPEVAAAPPPPKSVSRVAISSGVQQGFLIHQVQPAYPSIARAARVEGTVVLAAVINRDGSIQNLHVVSGHPMLVPAAIDAVKQWRYRPYLLSGQPVEVETQISVIFTLAH